MSRIMDTLTEVLTGFDKKMEPIREHDISKAVTSLRNKEVDAAPPMQLVAEAMAFDFVEDYQDEATGWGTYYGPMFVLNNQDGTATESPSIRRVTKEIIDYWIERAQTAKHPVLRARYADLAWDFYMAVRGESPHYSIAHIVIDSTIEISQGRYHRHETSVIKKLGRAINIAILLNDSSRIKAIRDAIINYEDSISEDSKLGLWGFSYDLLFSNDKVDLSETQEQKLISDLEGHLKRASQPADKEDADPWAVEAAAQRLAKYYRKVGRNEDTRRVNSASGKTYS